jgi:tRNA A-37 threonylcarbamoyl transferase component Bud32
MAILIDCPCGKKLRIRAELAGKTVKCPACGAKHVSTLVSSPTPVHATATLGAASETPAGFAAPALGVAAERTGVGNEETSPAEPREKDRVDKKPPRQIGAYVIDKALGHGAHGIVYRAHAHKDPSTPIALKVVESRGNLDHLLLEPALLSQLDHPCIVGIEDYFVSGEDLVLALEYIDGPDLETELKRGRTFSQAEIRDLLLQLASALAQAHSRSIIHRDIKPSNILVVRNQGGGRFVLTDFGIGRRAEGIQEEKHGGGTFLYMAPEQLRGRPGPQSDLWALGVVAYRLLTGRLPFPGPSLPELSQQILYGMPPPPSPLGAATIDPDLEAIVLRLLDKSLQERFASAEELLIALGFRGAPQDVLARRRRPARAPVRTNLDRQLDRAILLRALGLVAAVLLYVASGGGILSGVLLLLGVAAFYVGQGRKRPLITALALALMASHVYLRYVVPTNDNAGMQFFVLMGEVQAWLGPAWAPVLQIAFLILFAVLFLVILFLPVFAGWMYASLRRLQRQRMLRRAAKASGPDLAGFLGAFGATVDSRFEDVEFHLKYAEALFNGGHLAAAAVEARLLLVQDPYHFSGNLLLAHAWHNLGLYGDCLRLCEDYLAVSGYCFEFGELRQQCRRRLAVP